MIGCLPDFVGCGDEHGSASVYHVSTLEKATAGLTHGETEASAIPPVGTLVCFDEGYEFYNAYSIESWRSRRKLCAHRLLILEQKEFMV